MTDFEIPVFGAAKAMPAPLPTPVAPTPPAPLPEAAEPAPKAPEPPPADHQRVQWLDVDLPYGWDPMPHQLEAWRYMQNGGTRADLVWHRRSGKDSTALNWTAVASARRKGTYWHMLPEKEQARKAIWNGIDQESRRIIDQAFPPDIRSRTVDDEMRMELKSGSMWQVVGSDSYNSLVGSNPVGVIFSEYSLANPAAWDYIRPILAQNGGWAMFLYTPRGRNHGFTLYEMARKNKDWFAQLLTVDDTLILTPEQIQAERDSGMDDDFINQEYFCSWMGVRQGSIFGKEMQKMRLDGRVGKFPYDRRFPVNTFWDIGHGDATSVWFHQQVHGMDRFIHAYEKVGEDPAHFMLYLKDRGYLYGKHYFPHDTKNVTLASKSHPLGKNVWDQMQTLGLRDLQLVPRTPDIWTAIGATRSRMSTACIDEDGCANGISALESYHKKWDDANKTFLNTPVHDWSSNYCDAFRQWATGHTGNTTNFTLPTGQAMQIVVPAGRSTPMQLVRTVGHKTVGY